MSAAAAAPSELEPPPPDAEAEDYGQAPTPGPHPLTRRAIWLPLACLLAVLLLPFAHYALRGEAAVTATVPFSDDFERAELGEHWFSTGGHWRIVDGWLYSPGVKNNPLWLQAKLPADVVVEFDVRAESIDGDAKFEIFGNGRDHASGYVGIFGGWKNSVSVLARLNEHGRDRKEIRTKKVEIGRTYRFKIERAGDTLSWHVDGEPFLSWKDDAPLKGPGNDRLGFSTWATDVYFDNLTVRSPD